jgi:hypothetical protein
MKMYTGEPILPETSPFVVEIAGVKFRNYKSLDADH